MNDTELSAPEAGLGEHLLASLRESFLEQKTLAERALAQLDDEAFFAPLDPRANSPALIVKHLAGNLRSRWRDVLASDGETPDRDRDAEFEPGDETRAELMRRWEAGWAELFRTLATLGADDLSRRVTIRAAPLSVTEALLRALAHASHHVGQLVLLAKHARGADWRTLSVPKRGRGERLGER